MRNTLLVLRWADAALDWMLPSGYDRHYAFDSIKLSRGLG